MSATVAVERVALYLPQGSANGRRVAASDEDELTLAVEAIDRLALGPPGPSDVVLVGEFPPVTEAGLRARWPNVRVARRGGGAPEFFRAVEEAVQGPATPRAVLVVTAEIPSRSGGAEAAAAATGDGSVALLVVSTTSSPWSPPVPATSVLDALRAMGGRSDAGVEWVGDWAEEPAAGSPVDPTGTRGLAGLSTAVVSEGAYVPRPTYLEHLPSRWWFAADRCGACGVVTLPPVGVCRGCGRTDRLARTELPRLGGVVVASTAIRTGGQPTEFDAQVAALGGYGVVLAELAPGVRVTLQVTGSSNLPLALGSRVDAHLRRLYPMEGEWRYGRKAVPSTAAGEAR